MNITRIGPGAHCSGTRTIFPVRTSGKENEGIPVPSSIMVEAVSDIPTLSYFKSYIGWPATHTNSAGTRPGNPSCLRGSTRSRRSPANAARTVASIRSARTILRPAPPFRSPDCDSRRSSTRRAPRTISQIPGPARTAAATRVARHHAARVSAHERPLLHLPFELDHVQRVLFRSRSRRREVRGFAFDREPGQRNRRIASVQPQIRICRASMRPTASAE